MEQRKLTPRTTHTGNIVTDSPTCSFHEQGFPAVYALDALDGAERHDFEAHLLACPVCSAEVAALGVTAAQLSLAVDETAATPSPALRQRILDAVAADSASSAGVPASTAQSAMPADSPSGPPPARPVEFAARRGLPAFYAVAAVVLLGLGLALLAWNLTLQRELRAVAAERDQARTALAVYTIGVPNGQAPSAEVLYLHHRRQAILVARNLPPLQPGQVYQVWLIPPDGQPRGVGIFRDPTGETAFSGDLSQYQTIAITIEPGYGSPAPTSPPILADALQ